MATPLALPPAPSIALGPSITRQSAGRWERLKARGELLMMIASGLAIGGFGVWLAHLGNPTNSGICVSCFVENLAGSLGLHGNSRMQYIRPEMLGFLLGAAAIALLTREFQSQGGSSPVIRFLGGVVMIVGCAVFMGCPIRLALRLGAGDLSAVAGLVGLVFGIWLGFAFLRRGFYLGDSSPLPLINGLIVPLAALALLAGAIVRPAFLQFSTSGPGSQRAPFLIALGAGLVIGIIAQRSRFCVTGTIGNFLISRDTKLLSGVASMLGSAVLVSLLLGSFHPGFEDQPGSHLAYGWSFLGMALVGVTSILIGGCPFRQLILASQGSSDAAAAVIGMVGGGAIVQAWNIGSTNLGPTPAGKIATLAGLALVFTVGIAMRVREEA